MRKRAHVFYSGRVQGVGFRYSTREVACGYEVTGRVRNLPDGRVELVAEGGALTAWCAVSVWEAPMEDNADSAGGRRPS